MSRSWQDVVAYKRQSLKDAIPAEWVVPPSILPPPEQTDVSTFIAESGWFSTAEKAILSLSAAQLLPRLASGRVSAEEVTRAFCKSAAAAQQLINPLTVIFFEEALETARELDKHLRSTGKPRGPLHGLPISIKDNFHIRGKDACQGFTALVEKPSSYHSPIIKLLLDSGAVLYVKTNVPPGMKRPETDNVVFGKTLNPKNRLWSVGGSSGGEGALIAFGGSPLGVGSDMGGSCRIPAACGGIFTLRPSSGRWSISKTSVCTAGQDSIQAVPGPMGRTLEDVALFSRIFSEQAPWTYDPQCVPLRWRHVDPPSYLKLAVIWNDGLVSPTPPVQRALEGAVSTLRDAGHEIVDWKITAEDIQEIMAVAGLLFADGGHWIHKIVTPTGEPISPDMAWYGKGKAKTIFELHEMHILRDNVRMKWFEKWNAIGGLDGLLLPTSPYSIPEHGKFTHVAYTVLFNLLDYPATSFPSGYHANAALDAPFVDHTPLSEADGKVHAEYDPGFSHGAPVSLQVVGRRLEEEKTLMMTDVVYRCLHAAPKE